jgi:hypothetical protein
MAWSSLGYAPRTARFPAQKFGSQGLVLRLLSVSSLNADETITSSLAFHTEAVRTDDLRRELSPIPSPPFRWGFGLDWTRRANLRRIRAV